MKVPRAYVAALVLLAAFMGFTALTAAGVLTVESLFFLLLNYVFQVFAVTVLAALGGVFVGMLLAHRMLGRRSFTPFEREMLATMADVRARLDRQDKRDEELFQRLEGLEKRLR